MVRVRSTNDDEVRGTSGWKKGKRLFKGPTWQRAHLPGKEPCRKLQSLPWDGLKTSLSHDETRSLSSQEAKRVEVPPNRTTLCELP
ncbi:uncharacterized protein LOC121387377 isoform X3 [Gigantopelta aegis]|uniref:uncharacterized protein LOC121387377 isoform X3 n=1 Tax=Gigantopelta aegis TaxID=1735272 RepID=UPI001B888EEE|nr:uncharacterized protein LOC121387377 isoform X3 [Gigantopelta aegis]